MTLEESNNAFMQPNHKQLTLTFSDGTVITNSNIVQESLMIDEALCSGNNLLFGACESSCFSIRIVNTEQSFEGLDVDLFLYMETEDGVYANEDDDYYISDTDYLFQYTGAISEYIGKYKVLSDTPTSDRVYRDLVCYDYMYFLSDTDVGEWYSSITFPISVKDFRDSLFEYMEFTQEETTLINDDYMIVNKYETSSVGFREVIESICALNGVFGHINNKGVFTYISLPSADTLEVPYYINGSSAYEDYETDTITGILVCNDTETGNLVGEEGNVFTLMGNICLIGAEYSDATVSAIETLLSAISTVSYRPFKVQMYGNPYLELGTNITFETKYCTVNSIVATRVLTGIQAMRDEYRALGDRAYPTNVNSLASEVRRIKGSTISLKSDVTETRSEVVLKVTSGGEIVQVALSADASTGSEFKVGADNISFIADDKIELSANSLEINSTNFKVDSNGNITATGGTIGGFTIGSTKLYNGMTSFSDTTNNGVYVGTDGIALGKGAFKVTNEGAITATSGTIGGFELDSTGKMIADGLVIDPNNYYLSVGNITSLSGSVRLSVNGVTLTNSSMSYNPVLLLNRHRSDNINEGYLLMTYEPTSGDEEYLILSPTEGLKHTGTLNIVADDYVISHPENFRDALGLGYMPIFRVESYSYAYTIGANSELALTGTNFGKTTPTGYVSLCFRYISTGNANVVIRNYNATSTGTDGVVNLKNTASSSQTGTCYIQVAYTSAEVAVIQ